MPTTQNTAKETPWVRSLTTTAGDHERESKTRLQNAMEALGVEVFLLVVLWPLGYLCGVLGGFNSANVLANLLLVAGAVYLLFVAPFLHKDTASSWGLGNPKALWRMLRGGSPAKRAVLIVVIAALFVALNIMGFMRWGDVEHFFNLNKLARFFGAEHPKIQDMNHTFPGVLLVLGFNSVLAFIIVTGAIRYDNFLSAFRTAMYISLPLLVLSFLAAYLHRGTAAFAHLSFGTWAIGVLGYVFWGFVQQLLFSSYFGTRFRKAFPPSQAPGNVIPKERRWKVTSIFGLTTALGGAALASILIAAIYGTSGMNVQIFAWLIGFLLPLGAVYGYFFCLDKKRLLVATLSASCFGMIHIDSYGLVAVTWGLGIVLVYVFMEDKNRNLVALGFIHGLLGSTFGALFSKGESGVLEIDYSVGPWNIDNPGFAAVIIPMLCIAIYLAVMAWCVKNIHETIEE